MYASARQSTVISGLVHAAFIALILLTGGVVKTLPPRLDHVSYVLPPDAARYLAAVPAAGGGGGQQDKLPPRLGHLPKAVPRPFVPPTVHIENTQPVLSMEESVYSSVPIAIPPSDLRLIGSPTGVPGVNSAGPGSRGGTGGGHDGGIGHKNGPGTGDGDTLGVGARSDFREAITQPVLIFKVEPEYSEEARRTKLQGTVLLRVVVNERGAAERIVVSHGLGLGLDERAIEAVRKWRFRPAMRGKQPVPAAALVEVSFRLL